MYSYRYRYYHSRSGIFYFDGEDINEWLNQLESYFIKSQIDEHRKLEVATGHLTGQALEWYHQWNRARLQRRLQIWTWTDFVRDLKFQFRPPEPVKSQSEILVSMSKMVEELKQSISEMKAQSSIYMSSLSTLNSQTTSLCDVQDVEESLKVEEEQSNIELFDLTEAKEIIEDMVNMSDVSENQECSLQVEFILLLSKSALFLNHESVDMDSMAAKTEVISTYSSSKLGSTDKIVNGNVEELVYDMISGSTHIVCDDSSRAMMDSWIAAPHFLLELNEVVPSIDFVFGLVLNNIKTDEVNELLRVGCITGLENYSANFCSPHVCQNDSMCTHSLVATNKSIYRFWCSVELLKTKADVVCMKPPPLPPDKLLVIDISSWTYCLVSECIMVSGCFCMHNESLMGDLKAWNALYGNNLGDVNLGPFYFGFEWDAIFSGDTDLFLYLSRDFTLEYNHDMGFGTHISGHIVQTVFHMFLELLLTHDETRGHRYCIKGWKLVLSSIQNDFFFRNYMKVGTSITMVTYEIPSNPYDMEKFLKLASLVGLAFTAH